MNSKFEMEKGGFRKELRFTTILLIIFILLLMSFPMFFINGLKADEDTLWEATILFTATDYGSDTVIFGEDATAHDGPPTDLGLDALNPPPSTPPIIDAWFDAGLDNPYGKIRGDIKYGPDSHKVWNLYVKTDPSEGYTVDMTWSYDATSEYATIGLYDVTGTILLVNMLTTDTYSFVSTGTDHFQIICEGGSNGSPDIPNQLPVADASNSDISGLPGVSLTFDGVLSHDPDPDGYIKNWSWNFGDGTVRYGEIVNHVYVNSGNYHVILTVTDNLNGTDTDLFSVVIGTENNAPLIPEITGNQKGKRDSSYSYIFMSIDPDNDNIRYNIDWGDGSTEESDFLSNGALYRATHSWTSVGVFTIIVTATDGRTVSDSMRLVVLIDAQYVDDLGYLIDKDGDGVYDSFYSNATRGETNVLVDGKEKYLIDSNDDGEWDYSYDQILGMLSTYGEKEPSNTVPHNQFPVIFLLVTIVLIIIGIITTFIIIKI